MIFPIWDRLWHTHAVPPSKPYRMGLSGGESANYASVWAAYYTPLARLARPALWRMFKIWPLFASSRVIEKTPHQASRMINAVATLITDGARRPGP
jgi:hypothetical protein